MSRQSLGRLQVQWDQDSRGSLHIYIYTYVYIYIYLGYVVVSHNYGYVDMWYKGFPKIMSTFLKVYSRDYSILGCILGSPI